MQQKSKKKPFVITLQDDDGKKRDVKVKAVDDTKARDRALKFYPTYRVVNTREA